MAGLGQEKPKYFNLHNVYVRSGMATLDQLKSCVAAFKRTLANHPSPQFRALAKGEIEANIVTNMKNETQHFGYLWVEYKEVYWILCGYNPDGTERVRVAEDTSPKEEIDLDNIDFSTVDLNTIATMSAKEAPKIIEKLPPLFQFPGYEYTEEQRRVTHEYLLTQEKEEAIKEGREPREIPVPKYGYFELSRSSTMELSNDKSPNVLRGEVPKWVNYKMLKSAFAKFAIGDASENPTVYHEKDSRGSSIDIYNYGHHFKIKIFGTPVRNRPDYNVVTIEYPMSGPATGIFANQMRRKTIFVNPKPNKGENPEVVCIFDYFRGKTF